MPITTENVRQWLQTVATVLHEKREYLTQLDSAIGDADHGTNMDRGFTAVAAKLATLEESDSSTLLKTVGTTLVSTVGGASGPLYGTAFLRMATATAGKVELQEEDVVTMLNAAVEGVKTRGKAHVGEKTMLDALIPAVEAAQKAASEHLGLAQLLQATAAAAEEGMKKTIPLVATKGRASYLGERSAGHQDPGATSTSLMLQALSDTVS